MRTTQCRICNSETSLRGSIERELLKGKSYREIAHQFLNYFDCDLHGLEQSIAKHYKKHLGSDDSENKPRELTKEELNLLDRFGRGEVGFEEASRIVASIVFENLLAGEQKISVKHWLEVEELKLKSQEVNQKEQWAVTLMNKMFNGKLPPRICPSCGNDFSASSPREPQENRTLGYGL